ncbi:NAD(P)/FAD-dependent oxidoreductase [Streptomyces mirabilis]|uniref:Pyruvate/2-oxoglutarate dehydrogenase complex, dihydrolipoamide dehydrogenase (E3) component n=1 Tax=Streptomyces mirabilis TaxID=68239 RepID=A0A1I2HT91_9ACTN|nr:FAD/NAD(P)-binding oxidoreductase [Streptomyces mirabilis]SFF31621.1 Pyruvate/2-oxoglutarate dehydrogenase complex, dihydrolipoamide dehydrogenase (E3) component [Streptomyces mirabilis]
MTEVLVVGGGPAGMAAALAARRHGARVVLLEAGDDVGGQYWRHLPGGRADTSERLWHHDWDRFVAMRDELLGDEGCEVVTGAHVWSVDRRDDAPPLVHVFVGEPDGQGREPRTFDPAALVLATGAYERTLPFHGWDLPGVFTAGAAQALAKGERVAVGRRVLVAGAGPFLLPVVSSLLRIGAEVAGVVEAAGPAQLAGGWATRPWQLLAARRKAGELAGYACQLTARRIPYRTGAAIVAAHGIDRVEAVTVARLTRDWTPIPGTERRIEADAVCVSHGFVPRTELATAAGCAVGVDGAVTVDERQRTSVPGVLTAGELTGIGGVDLALAEGEIAGTVAAGGVPAPGAVHERAVFRKFAARLAAAHGIRPGWRSWVDDDTVVCRCEDVTAGALRQAAELTGSRGLRSLKLTTRAGLGLCQGRTCGRTVEDMLTGSNEPGLLDLGRTAHRPVAIPVRLGELAASTSTSNREDVP